MTHPNDFEVPAGASAGVAGQAAAYDSFWQPLLRFIRQKKVIPIIGQDLLTLQRQEGEILYSSYLAGRLAAQLGVSPESLPQTGAINEVVLRYLEGHEKSANLEAVYGSLYDLVSEDGEVPIPEPLRILARIQSFRLFITTTFDPLLARALEEERKNEPKPIVIAFSRTGKQRDISETSAGSVVYQLLGGHNLGGRNFAVTENDLLEFLHTLHRNPPDRLFEALEGKHLLLLGSSFSDWLARFFIRLMRLTKQDLSQPDDRMVFIADPGLQGDPKLRLFLKHFCRFVRTYSGNLHQFLDELQQRAMPGPSEEPPQAPRPRPVRRQRIGVFLSYAREDIETARAIRDALQALKITVWMDETHLMPGERFDEEIERRIEDSLLFVAPVSAATLPATEPRYFRREWNYALNWSYSFGYETFIVPVVLDDTAIADAQWDFRKFNTLWLAQEASPAALALKLQSCYRKIQAAQEARA